MLQPDSQMVFDKYEFIYTNNSYCTICKVATRPKLINHKESKTLQSNQIRITGRILYRRDVVFCLLCFVALRNTAVADLKTQCGDGFDLNYTLPMFRVCKNGTIPKLIPPSADEDRSCVRKSRLGIPPGRRVCRVRGKCLLQIIICW